MQASLEACQVVERPMPHLRLERTPSWQGTVTKVAIQRRIREGTDPNKKACPSGYHGQTQDKA